MYLILSPHQRCWAEEMISMIKSLSGAYTAMSACHLNTKAPPLPAANPPCTSSPPCLHSPSKLCISALGGKHYTGLAQGSIALDILRWPLAVILFMARVSSSTFIRTSAEGEARESCFFFISERKTKKTTRNQKKKMCQDLLMFYSVNQRCYLTQVPYVIFITLMIPKITKDFFSLHGLYEWCSKMWCMCPLPPISCLFFPSPFSSSFSPSHLHSTHAPPLCVLLLHLCSDYSSIDSHTDVAIGRCAELALDTHNQPCWCLWGTTTLLVMWSVVVHNRNTLLSTALLTGKAFSLVH